MFFENVDSFGGIRLTLFLQLNIFKCGRKALEDYFQSNVNFEEHFLIAGSSKTFHCLLNIIN